MNTYCIETFYNINCDYHLYSFNSFGNSFTTKHTTVVPFDDREFDNNFNPIYIVYKLTKGLFTFAIDAQLNFYVKIQLSEQHLLFCNNHIQSNQFIKTNLFNFWELFTLTSAYYLSNLNYKLNHQHKYTPFFNSKHSQLKDIKNKHIDFFLNYWKSSQHKAEQLQPFTNSEWFCINNLIHQQQTTHHNPNYLNIFNNLVHDYNIKLMIQQQFKEHIYQQSQIQHTQSNQNNFIICESRKYKIRKIFKNICTFLNICK